MRRNIDTWFNALLFLSLSLLHHSSLCSAGPVFAEASVFGSNFLTMNQISLEAASHSFLQVEQKEGAGSVPRDDFRGTVHLPSLRGLASSGLRCCLRQEFLQATKHLNASFQIPFEAVVIWGGGGIESPRFYSHPPSLSLLRSPWTSWLVLWLIAAFPTSFCSSVSSASFFIFLHLLPCSPAPSSCIILLLGLLTHEHRPHWPKVFLKCHSKDPRTWWRKQTYKTPATSS